MSVTTGSHCDKFTFHKYSQSETNLPGGTDLNMINTSIVDLLPMSKVHYLPVIEASPTDFTTIRTILDNIGTLACKLQI